MSVGFTVICDAIRDVVAGEAVLVLSETVVMAVIIVDDTVSIVTDVTVRVLQMRAPHRSLRHLVSARRDL